MDSSRLYRGSPAAGTFSEPEEGPGPKKLQTCRGPGPGPFPSLIYRGLRAASTFGPPTLFFVRAETCVGGSTSDILGDTY
eukprot:1736553-Heterocapsa_arctica.AAC.1